MAVKCGYCGSTSGFETNGEGVLNIKTQLFVISCRSCHAAIGVFDMATHDRVKEIEKMIKAATAAARGVR